LTKISDNGAIIGNAVAALCWGWLLAPISLVFVGVNLFSVLALVFRNQRAVRIAAIVVNVFLALGCVALAASTPAFVWWWWAYWGLPAGVAIATIVALMLD
jgi:hypothetical protein